MDLLFINNKLQIEANPDYYDYCHEIELKNDKKCFKLCDGGGQHMNLILGGHYEINDNILKLFFEYSEDIYDDTKTVINKTNTITYQIIKEEKKHFDGYSMRISKYTIKFDKSPFAYDDNKYDESYYPLTFYTQLETIECDVLLERFKNKRNNFFNNDNIQVILNENIIKIKEEFNKTDISDENLKKILEFKDELLNFPNTPLRFATWLYNDDDDNITLFQQDIKMIITIGQNIIKTFYYGYLEKENNELRNNTYEYSNNYEKIKEIILGNEKYKEHHNYDLLYNNLQKFRTSVISLINSVQ